MSGADAIAGEDFQEQWGEEIGFQDIAARDTRLRVSRPWPADQQPPTTASLLSIAPNRELVAIASPDGLLVSSTEKTRRRYIPRPGKGEDDLRPLDPDFTLSVPQVSHVTFSADESCLIIAAQEGGGLAVYDTNKLANGAQPDFQIGTNGTSVRELLPNPNASSDLAHLVVVVLTSGHLLLADLKNRSLVNNSNGSPGLLDNVSAASWSKLGKQIVAGLSDSTAVQIDAQGNVKSQIPQPPQLQTIVQEEGYDTVQGMPITSILWLSTYEFFIVYSPTYADAGEDLRFDSIYFIAARAGKGQPLEFRRFNADINPTYGTPTRLPAHQFVLRINEWHKAADMLIVASSASPALSVLGHFKDGAKGFPADEFVSCVPELESRKAQVPMSAAQEDALPLGFAIDLSTNEVAPGPVPKEDDEFRHSGLPLPALYLLDTEGILNIWWFVYSDAVRKQQFCPGITHRSGRYAKYRKFTQETGDVAEDTEGRFAGRERDDESDETEPLGDPVADPVKPAASTIFPNSQGNSLFGSATSQQTSAPPAPSAFGASHFSKPTSTQQSTFGQPAPVQNSPSAFGSSGFGLTNALGAKSSPWATPSTETPAKPAFGQVSASQPSVFGQPSNRAPASAFGNPSPIGGGKQLFGQPSQPTSGFGAVGQMGANKPSPFGTAVKDSSASPFGAYASKSTQPNPASPFAAAAKDSNASPFGQYAAKGSQQNTASPFASTASSSPFANFGQKKPELPKESSMGSTATLGSVSSGWGQPSGLGSSFASKPPVSRESTMGGSDEPKQQGGGLPGLSGFKLSSGFQGDGSARDDLPKPKTSGGLFGPNFGAALGATDNEPSIKAEPGTEEQPSLQQIPAVKEKTPVPDDAPLPPDPSTYKAPAMSDDAPLPPDPSTYKAPKFPNDLPGMPGFGAPKQEDKDVPIAGSPPVDVTNSQTFSPEEGSDLSGPPEDDDDDLEEGESDEDGEEQDEDDEDEEDEEDQSDDNEEEWEEEEEEQESTPYQPENPAALANFMNRLTPKSPPHTASKQESRTPSSDEKTEKSSYTPAGLPKGPVFPPPASRTQQSPRSPSPQRAVTSPVRGPGIPEKSLPSQIKTSAIPPAKPVQRPAAPPKPREPTAGELEDEAIARVEALLAAPLEPSKDFPSFYTHTDYTGAVENTGIGGQIERVFRDVNAMIHTVGLNARSLGSYLHGQEVLKKTGERTVEDLDSTDEWSLGDLPDLSKLLESIGTQLENGKLEDVRDKLEDISDEQRETLKLKAKTTEMKKQIQSHTDPTQRAMRDAAPLSAETQAQQAELRQGVQKVQTLLSEVEQKMSMLRADMAAMSSKDGQTNGAPVPTVEAVTNTILKMTAMVQQKSADIDVLEAQIKRLPKGIASLRLDDDYEDDLSSRLAGNRLLTNRSSPAATPPRRPRMAANGDPLGMSGMFGTSRFQTPPSNRRSLRFTPEASGLGRSTGSLGASTRRKMSEVTGEEVELYLARVGRRAKVLGALKSKVERKGPKVVRVE